MGKFLRPRRGHETESIDENILLKEGEIFLEYPDDGGVGKSPGRIIIGSGSDRYNQKENASTESNVFKPFITDPQIYTPVYRDSNPSEEYRYDDGDRGAITLSNIIMGRLKLPVIIGMMKEVLCRHTDNLRYDNDRLNALEEKIGNSDILDMKVGYVDVDMEGAVVSSKQLSLNTIESGYEFLKWESVGTLNGITTEPVFIENISLQSTYIRTFSGKYLNYLATYRCYYTIVKRNPHDPE